MPSSSRPSSARAAAVGLLSGCVLLSWTARSARGFSIAAAARSRAAAGAAGPASLSSEAPSALAAGDAAGNLLCAETETVVCGETRHRAGRRRRRWPLPKNVTDVGGGCRRGGEEGDQVHKWLLKSTSSIIGEELTLELVNGAGECDRCAPPSGRPMIGDRSQPAPPPPSNASAAEELLRSAESVVKAWSRWIARRPGSGAAGDLHLLLGDGEDPATCAPANAARIVDAIVHRVATVDERRVAEGWEGDDAEWELKLVELVNAALDVDAWSDDEEDGGRAVRRAEGWLTFLRRRLDYGAPLSDDRVLRRYEESHRAVIKACVRSRRREHLERAVELLEDMLSSVDDRGAAGVRPTTRTYNLVLYGLANCEPCPANAERAEGLLRGMVDCRGSGREACRPDANTFRQVITAWTKSGTDAAAAGNARRVLDGMISDFPSLDPDASTFNALMTLYLKLGKTEDALSLFDRINSMRASGRSDTRPDAYSVNLMLNAMARRRPLPSPEDMEAMEGILGREPTDRQSYNIVIDAWAKSNLREAAARAERLLDSMVAKCRDDPDIAPDGYTFTSTINAIERSRHHKARGSWAEAVFRRMKELHSQGLVEEPATPVYNALMNTLISCGESGSTERAEALFSEMQAANLTNTRTCNTLLKGYSMMERSRRSGRIISFARPRKAEQLLDRMELSYESEGRSSAIRPDKYSYTTVISAYGRSNSRRKAAKAYAILQRMIDAYAGGNAAARPGTFAFNAVLNACAHTRRPGERLEGFTVLCAALILLRDWAPPDHTTYGTFLQASAGLLPPDEEQKLRVVEAVFSSCVREGQVGQMVVRSLRNVASPELYDTLVGKFLTDDGLDIPPRWRRNVDGNKDCLATSYLESK